ncbi:hypothetical protein OOK13_01260 [Streptomyces sp. NBC_00378]|uniref:hypothetical protein n=1 Tax=unclassified Streptomyces TaxID=2593676 RepID=UPI00225A4D37|nr:MULTISPECIES: hypothetical protein [unclassified Streptomyces]MCX5107191.1 hypothetical protein [Streptomyces sp. NBC_00378]
MMIPVLPDVSDARSEGQIPMDGGRRRLPKFREACIRCPVLQIDPRRRSRLIEIIQNLRDRVREARANGWLGEVEGLQVSLDAANAKLHSLKRTPADGRPQLVDLGMPLFTDPPSP